MEYLEDFTRQLKISVDSRIQRSKYQLNRGVMDMGTKSGRQDAIKGTEQVFKLIEKHSRSISMLLKIRSRITPKNALRVLALLESGDYLGWGEEDLKGFFRPSPSSSHDSPVIGGIPQSGKA